MYKVLVMMSVFNGECFLEEQLQSILDNCSEQISVELLIRDDGSSDSTKEIIDRYGRQISIRFFEGENIKPAQSFRKLVGLAPLGFDAYAYADQDDIWEKEKLRTALSVLNQYSSDSTLWYSGVSLLQEGEITDTWVCPEERAGSLFALLCTCSSTNGCTMVFNERLMRALKACSPGCIDMHDSWTNMVCLSVGGHVYCERKPMIQYRIHGKQVTGKKSRRITSILYRIFHPAKLRSLTAGNLLTNDLVLPQNKELIGRFARYKEWENKRFLLKAKKPICISKREFLKFKIQVMFNAY